MCASSSYRRLCFIGGLLVFSTGCTKPPALPTLFSRQTERLVLDHELDVADFRKLFDAMNRGKRLEPLRPYWQNASDSELREIAALANKYFYEEAYRPDGLARLMNRAVSDRLHSQWKTDLNDWAKEPSYADEARALTSALTTPGLADLLQRDSGLLDARWVRWLDRARDEYKEQSPHAQSKEIDPDKLLSDLRTLAKAPAFRKASSEFGKSLLRHDPFVPLINAARGFRENGQPLTFEGFGYGLASLVSTKAEIGDKNIFDALLEFVKAADGKPGKLLWAIQDRLKKEPASILPLVTAADDLLPKVVLGALKERFSRPRSNGKRYDKAFWLALARRKPADPPTPETIDLFIAIRESIERVTDANRPPSNSDFFLSNLPIHLNAYVLTKWGEDFARKNLALWEKSNSDLSDEPWKCAVSPGTFEIDLISNKGGSSGLSEEADRDLRALGGLDEFADALSDAAGRDGFGTFNYSFTAAKSGSFGEEWSRAIEECHKQRPFADAGAAVRSLVFGLTRATGSDGMTAVDRLEGLNLMDTFNLAVGALDDGSWVSLRNLVFDDFSLGRLKPEFRDLVLEFYDSRPDLDESYPPELRQRAVTLLSTVQTIRSFDEPLGKLPSPLTVYRKWAGAFPIEALPGLTSVFRFVGDSEVVAGKFGPQGFAARYPALHGLLQQGRPAARGLHALSWLTPEEGEDLRDLLSRAFSRGGWEAHLDFLESWSAKSPAGVTQLLSRLQRSQSRLLPSVRTFSPEARAWLRRFLESGDHLTLWRYFERHGSVASLVEIVNKLKKLSREGHLGEGFRMLSAIENERIRLLAGYLEQWDRSGELVAFLETLETALLPSISPPATP